MGHRGNIIFSKSSIAFRKPPPEQECEKKKLIITIYLYACSGICVTEKPKPAYLE